MAERLTQDLLKRLLEADDPQQFFEEAPPSENTLVDYLEELLARHGGTRADVARASGMNGTFTYDIFKAKCRPGRDSAIMLAFGLGCSYDEARRLLRYAGVSDLSPKAKRDAIIIWCINQGLSREECDDELWRLGEPTLLRTSKPKR